MSDVDPVRKNIQIEEVQFRGAVSESVGQKLGGSINFINDFQYDTKAFFLNGLYNIVAAPQTGVDGLYVVPYDCDFWRLVYIDLWGRSANHRRDIPKFHMGKNGRHSGLWKSTAGFNFHTVSIKRGRCSPL